MHRLLLLIVALAIAGCSSSAGPTPTAAPTATLAPTATPTPLPSPTVAPTPSPTPLPIRKSIVNAQHPAVSVKAAFAAVTADQLAVVDATNKVSYEQCSWLISKYPHDGSYLLSCTGVIYPLYAQYVRSGDESYYTAALQFFNFVWNWNNAAMPGVTNHFDQQWTREQVVSGLTQWCRRDFPEFGTSIP
jgi:hypothetical protein